MQSVADVGTLGEERTPCGEKATLHGEKETALWKEANPTPVCVGEGVFASQTWVWSPVQHNAGHLNMEMKPGEMLLCMGKTAPQDAAYGGGRLSLRDLKGLERNSATVDMQHF